MTYTVILSTDMLEKLLYIVKDVSSPDEAARRACVQFKYGYDVGTIVEIEVIPGLI